MQKGNRCQYFALENSSIKVQNIDKCRFLEPEAAVEFIGRDFELSQLHKALSQKKSCLVVCYGRRRIGKSALIREVGKKLPHKHYLEIQGLAPNAGISNADQLRHFMSEFSTQMGHPRLPVSDWRQAFQLLSHSIGQQRCLVFLDEISWMGALDPTFTAILKIAWDTEFKKNPHLVLVLCGSVSSWIQDNLLQAKDFMGRISLELPLQELSISECNEFWGNKKESVSAKEKLRMLAVTGGVPRYLEEINPKESADRNIRDLCFIRSGVLFSEFEKIFNDIFQKRAPTYEEIVSTLASGAHTLSEICKKLGSSPGGKISLYLKLLVAANFLSSTEEWDLKSPEKRSKQISYRISDNYLRFYLKYIRPNKEKIKKNIFKMQSFTDLKGHEAIVGLQFENLIHNNMESVFKLLEIKGMDVLRFGPYLQRATKRKKSCQIDLLIQGKYDLYLCEIKSSSRLGTKVISEMETKLQILHIPRGVSIRKVLIHCSELEEKLLEQDYFDKIISFDDLLSL
ncbi:MAG: ATP-binding protein [Oligoflexia bacterium]|nr:ATP-binding protein [Oligoflexia bacterium]